MILLEVPAATFRIATPLVYGTIGETYAERAGILNLGIEGTMYAGAFFGFAASLRRPSAHRAIQTARTIRVWQCL